MRQNPITFVHKHQSTKPPPPSSAAALTAHASISIHFCLNHARHFPRHSPDRRHPKLSPNHNLQSIDVPTRSQDPMS